MTRHTPYHGFPVPESGDSTDTYPQVLQTLFDEIDRELITRGPRRLRPLAGDEGRLYLSTDYEDGPRMDYDTGETWVRVVGNYEIPSELARTDQPETFTGTVTFEKDIEGDLNGTAQSANEADHATTADNALALDDHPASSFTRRNASEEITSPWGFLARLTFEGGVTVADGTVDLPQHDGEDPPSSERGVGSMWVRIDEQPS